MSLTLLNSGFIAPINVNAATKQNKNPDFNYNMKVDLVDLATLTKYDISDLSIIDNFIIVKDRSGNYHKLNMDGSNDTIITYSF